MSNTQIHSPYATNVRKPSHTEYPADLLKFNAWKNPVENFEEAVKIISLKKLVLGEPAVVPFKFTHSDGSVTLELVFGIGSGDVDRPFIKCSVTNDVINEAIIVGEDEEVISQISKNVANSQEIENKIYEHLKWKPISDLLK